MVEFMKERFETYKKIVDDFNSKQDYFTVELYEYVVSGDFTLPYFRIIDKSTNKKIGDFDYDGSIMYLGDPELNFDSHNLLNTLYQDIIKIIEEGNKDE